MADAKRISPSEAQKLVQSNEAVLVCAYESEDKCKKVALKGAIPLTKFQEQLSSIDKERKIIFY